MIFDSTLLSYHMSEVNQKKTADTTTFYFKPGGGIQHYSQSQFCCSITTKGLLTEKPGLNLNISDQHTTKFLFSTSWPVSWRLEADWCPPGSRAFPTAVTGLANDHILVFDKKISELLNKRETKTITCLSVFMKHWLIRGNPVKHSN